MKFTLTHYLDKDAIEGTSNKFEIITRISQDAENYIDLPTNLFSSDICWNTRKYMDREIQNELELEKNEFKKIIDDARRKRLPLSLETIKQKLLGEKENVEVLSLLTNINTKLHQSDTDVNIKDMAKKVVKEVLKPSETLTKKLTKKEQLELDAEKHSAEKKLSLLKKHHNK